MPTIAEILAEGLHHHQTGDLQKAAAAYHQVLRFAPEQADALHLLGMLSFRQGDPVHAVRLIGRAIALEPTRALFHCNLAMAHQLGGQPVLAIESLRRALALNPDLIEAHNNLGSVFGQIGNFREAATCFQNSLRMRPEWLASWVNLGNALNKLHHLDEAAECFYRVLQKQDNHVEALTGLGIALVGRGAFAEAIQILDRSLRIKPDHADTYYHLALALSGLDRRDEAEANYRLTLRYQPRSAEACNNLGALISAGPGGQIAEAEKFLVQAVQIRPEFAEAHNNLGNIHARQMRMDKALAGYEAALRLRSEYPEAHLNRAIVWLRLGDFERGWPEYEWRWRMPKQPPRNFAQHHWDGSAVENCTILLHAEQGLGDTLQFIRFASLVKQKAGKVVVECQPELARLLARTPGVDVAVPQGSELPPFDLHAPLMSVPRLLATKLETVPSTVPYLSCEPEMIQAWGKEFAGAADFKIGIVWQGGPNYAEDHDRSLALHFFAPIAEMSGVRLYSLQKGVGRGQLARMPPSWGGVDLADRLHDMADTAAAVSSLDLVISVDTAVAHLAGGLGKPVWVALPFHSDWRWLLNRNDSPWYPTMRLFRQQRPGDWEEVFHRIAAQLCQRQEIKGLKSSTPRSVPVNTPPIRTPSVHPIKTESPVEFSTRPTTQAADLRTVATLRKQEDRQFTEEALRRILQTESDDAEALDQLANILVDQGQTDEAEACLHQAVRRRPGAFGPLHNLAVVLGYVGKFDEAMACFEEILRRYPNAAESQYSRALLRLKLGDFQQGLNDYEWRWRRPNCQLPQFPQPFWDGSALDGRTLLLLAEQGLGDMIQFVRYAPLIANRAGGKVLLACQPELVSLFASCPGLDRVVVLQKDSLPSFDTFAPVMSLARILGTTLETIPAATPYLAADPRRLEGWCRRLAETQNLKVGIVWQGRTSHPRDRVRSIPLAAFEPLARLEGVQLYSLQKGPGVEQLFKCAAGMNVIDLGKHIQDLADTAAALHHLDLTISIDTGVCHLAGALGKPVWVALPTISDWRWLVDRTDSPWYPTMRLFRQCKPGNWEEVFTRITAALAELCRAP